MITEEKYNLIVNKFGGSSSFAIWGNTVDDLQVFQRSNKPWKKINTKYVIVALNPAGEISGQLENFHSPDKKHADERLMKAISGTKLEGSFMTDLSATKSPDSSIIKITKKDVDELIAKIQLIGDIKNIVLLSSKCNQLEKWFNERGIRLFRILHYSRANGRAIKRFCLENNINENNSDEKYVKAVKKQISLIGECHESE